MGNSKLDRLTEQVEQSKASIRAIVEHPFRVIKRQFGFTKVRYRGLAKNDNALHTMFALCNLYMKRRVLAVAQDQCAYILGCRQKTCPVGQSERGICARATPIELKCQNVGAFSELP